MKPERMPAPRAEILRRSAHLTEKTRRTALALCRRRARSV